MVKMVVTPDVRDPPRWVLLYVSSRSHPFSGKVAIDGGGASINMVQYPSCIKCQKKRELFLLI